MSSSNQPLRYETEISNSKSLISPSIDSDSTYFILRTEQEAKASKPQPLSYIEKGFFYVLSRFKRL